MTSIAPSAHTLINATFKRKEGRVTLIIDASGFHEHLLRIGATKSRDGMKFVNRPVSTENTVDARNHTILPYALLSTPGTPVEIDVGYYYTSYDGKPPTFESLKKLGQSIETVAQGILDHYRPIEVSIRIVDKRGEVPYPVEAQPVPANNY